MGLYDEITVPFVTQAGNDYFKGKDNLTAVPLLSSEEIVKPQSSPPNNLSLSSTLDRP
jgi:hypothetical protein